MQADLERQRKELQDTCSEIFHAAIQAVSPEECIHRYLDLSGETLKVDNVRYDLTRVNKLFVIGSGKASAAMALTVERLLGPRIHDGIIITKYGHGAPLTRCRLVEAGHPVPDENGQSAANALLNLVSRATPEDLILCLLSGGGSALTPAPVEGISLTDKQETTRHLLSCGATIHEINTVRKHLSRIKGGRLCQAANGAAIVSLILSDVIGDDPDIIASGLTSPDPSTFNDCLFILKKYNALEKISTAVRRHLMDGAKGIGKDTPKPGEKAFTRVTNKIIGNISDALTTAKNMATLLGYQSMILTSTLHGEARETAGVLCSIAREIRMFNRPLAPPACLLSGGETTVTVKGAGLGGRNTEFALAAAMKLSGIPNLMLLSAGTDGTDGETDAAGAFADGSTVSRAEALGLATDRYLSDNNSYTYFKSLQDLLITGPTQTNVMDMQILLIR